MNLVYKSSGEIGITSVKKPTLDRVNNHHSPGIVYDEIIATTPLALSELSFSIQHDSKSFFINESCLHISGL